jgi:ATP-dependent RNA helicase RhlE
VGYTTPTPIQRQAIPIVLQGRDVMGLAQTGTGKTAAFVLPILQRLAKGPARQVRALILAPTRELAEQIHHAIVSLSRQSRVRSVSIYGGVSKHSQVAALRRGVEIVVACPGRLLDHINDGNIDLSRIEVLVLDEADRMCDMGFLPDIRRILRHLPVERQTLFFSATMPGDIRSLADSILKNPVPVQVGTMAPIETVSHALYPVSHALKPKLLLAMLEQTPTGRVLIFTRTKHRAHSLAVNLEKNGYRVSALQGNMTQNRRQAAIDGFRNGKYDILVATDIAARGIDVSQISHVINFDMPDTPDAYTHRIGRTGRAHQTGQAFSLTAQADEAMVREIEKVLGARIERRRLPGFDFGDFASASRPDEAGALQACPPQAQRNRQRFRPSIAGRRRAARF